MKLQPLRISAGWQVTYNQFYEIDPLVGNEAYFDGSSLLHLHNRRLLKFIDLSWRPELNLNGAYKLEVLNYLELFNPKSNELEVHPIWEQPYLSFSTKSRKTIVDKLESCMMELPPFKDLRILDKPGVINTKSENYRLELYSLGLTELLVSQVLADGNREIQDIILDHPDITKNILLEFLKKSKFKKVVNKAQQKLNSKPFKTHLRNL